MSNRNWVLPLSKRTISVGVTAADWSHLVQSLQPVAASTEWLHLDVMDGQFCPKITLGAWAIEALPDNYIIDAHVMTQSPLRQARELAEKGAHVVTLQYEALSEPVNALIELEPIKVRYQQQQYPLIRGISLCPSTSLGVLRDLLPHVELIQILTLDPRTGEKMDKGSFIARLKELKTLLDEADYTPLISVDGSMSLEVATASACEGANIIVSGSALFQREGLKYNLGAWRAELY